MLQKMENALCRAFLRARLALMKFEQEEDGNTVETIILIAVVVIVAGALLDFLTKDGFTFEGKNVGLVEYMFRKIASTFDGFFETK